MSSPIRHVLMDADGVLQDLPGGWYAAMEPFLGDRARDFLHETWAEELPTLAGEGDYLPMLAARLAAYGVPDPVESVYSAVWHRIDVIEESIDLVHALRASGYGVHLATNQEQHRAAYMRSTLGYDDLFDVSCYSCDLGAAKPAPEFFHRAADLIETPAASILFIDDNVKNVAGAREAGMSAEHWHFETGHEGLREAMRRHGVVLRS